MLGDGDAEIPNPVDRTWMPMRTCVGGSTGQAGGDLDDDATMRIARIRIGIVVRDEPAIPLVLRVRDDEIEFFLRHSEIVIVMRPEFVP